MSLSAIAPTESTESLVYAVLPVSASLCLASVFFSDAAQWLSVVGLLTPFFALFLYEMGWDEQAVKNKYEKALLKGSASEDFYHCNVFIRTWETTLEAPPGQSDISDYLDSEYRSFVSSSLSGYSARRRMWRQRVSLFILLSIPFLSFVIARTTDIYGRVQLTGYISPWFDSSWVLIVYFALLGGVWLLITVSALWLVNGARRARSKDIQSFLDGYVSYVYWQTMIATDAVRNPSEYQTGSEKWIVKTELESLDDILNLKDWDAYLARWLRVKGNIHRLATSDFRQHFRERTYRLWAQSIHAERSGRDADEARRRLTWFIYYSEKMRHNLDSEDASLLDSFAGVQGDVPFRSLMNPNLLLTSLSGDLLNEAGDENALTRPVAAALSIVLVGSEGDLSAVIRRMIQILHTGAGFGFDRLAMAQLIVKYVREINEHGREPVLSGCGTSQLMAVFSPAQNETDRIWLLRDWFSRAPASSMKEALEERLWRGILDDPDLERIITERANAFRGDYQEELAVLDALAVIYPKKKDALGRKRLDIEVKRFTLNR